MVSGAPVTASPPRPPPPQPAVEEEEEGIFRLLDGLEVFEVQGRDKRGRRILRVVGKFFPGMDFSCDSGRFFFRFCCGGGNNGRLCVAARVIKPATLVRYLEGRIFPELLGKKGKGGPFVVVYVHTYVQRVENFPGVSALRSIYESLSPAVRDNLEAVFFVHPGLQSRLFFATFGRFLFSAG